MIEMSSLLGSGESRLQSSDLTEGQALVSELNNEIGQASPALAFQIIAKKQALEDRVSFKRWLASNDEKNSQTQATQHLLNRAHRSIMM